MLPPPLSATHQYLVYAVEGTEELNERILLTAQRTPEGVEGCAPRDCIHPCSALARVLNELAQKINAPRIGSLT